mgnify:CR=1 FL=1
MPKKTDYCVTRVPSHDWDNLMETVTLDGTYSEEIKSDVWSALENMEDFSEPWIVIKIKNGEAEAKTFPNETSARKKVEGSKRKSLNQQFFCVKGQYQDKAK